MADEVKSENFCVLFECPTENKESRLGPKRLSNSRRSHPNDKWLPANASNINYTCPDLLENELTRIFLPT